jgi:8-oxo-dGTP pyrophosphatase MutT (NUDIX family)
LNDKKAKKTARKGKVIQQVAALPYRRLPSGITELLLLTSRQTSRFVIPKGWRMKRKADAEAAELEAQQEAGVKGRIDPNPLGTYQYWKRLVDSFVPITVVVYGLEVDATEPDWKERCERQRKWFTPEEAASLVDEPELASLIMKSRWVADQP